MSINNLDNHSNGTVDIAALLLVERQIYQLNTLMGMFDSKLDVVEGKIDGLHQEFKTLKEMQNVIEG